MTDVTCVCCEGVSLPNFTQNKRESSPYRWYCVDVISGVITHVREATSDAFFWRESSLFESEPTAPAEQAHTTQRHSTQ